MTRDSHAADRVILQDVSASRQVLEEQRRLAAIVDSSQDAIVSCTPDGVIESWNRGAVRLYGYTAEEMIGDSVIRLHPQGAQRRGRAARAAVERRASSRLRDP